MSRLLYLHSKIQSTSHLQIAFINGGWYFKQMIGNILSRIFIQDYPQIQIQFIEQIDKPDIIVGSILDADAWLEYSDSFRIGICGEPWDMSSRTFYDVFIDTKTTPSLLPQSPINIYYPQYVNSFYERYFNTRDQLIKPPRYPKTKFCAFLYGVCHLHREEFFDKLSLYKKVDALGRCRGNVIDGNCSHVETDRGTYTKELTYNDLAVQKYIPYKFTIAFENSNLDGYITEKIINPILAGSIPIYWGTPQIKNHFNQKSFISVDNFPSIDDCINHIIEVDQNNELYQKYLNEDFMMGNKFNEYLDLNEKKLENALKSVFVN